MTRRTFFLIPFLTLTAIAVLAAQESPEKAKNALSANQLLRDALALGVDVSVSASGNPEELWSTRVDKLTIPGRAVIVSLEGEQSRLKVRFTLYPGTKDDYVLVAQSEITVEGEYYSALTSLPVAHHEKVYYYPLGRAGENSGESPLEVRMAISVMPYLESLDEEARKALIEAFDASARFNLSREDP